MKRLEHQPANGSDTAWRILLAGLLLGLILAVAGLLVATLGVLLLVLAGLLLGVFLHGLTSWLSVRLRLSYRWTYPLVILLLAGALLGSFLYMGSQIATQLSELSVQLQTAGDRLVEIANQYEFGRAYLPSEPQVKDIVSGRVLPGVVHGLQSAVWGLTALAVILCVGLYVAYDPGLYRVGLIKLVPPEHRDRYDELFDKVYSTLGNWIVGRLLSMSLVGVLTTLGLWLLGVPLPFTLGVLTALLTFIPNIGPILAAVPQSLLALQLGIDTVLYVLILNVALQTVESYLITPLIQRYEVTLPPALTIATQLLMGVLVGLIGLMMAAPLTAAVLVTVQTIYVRDRLHDPRPGRLAERG